MPRSWPGTDSTTSRAAPDPALPPGWTGCTPVASTGGRAGPAFAGRRRSLRALRATHSRKRYRTARNASFRPTETGSSTRSLQLEDDLGRPQLDRVACAQRLAAPADGAAVDPDAVRRAEVVDRPRPVVLDADLGVPARHVAVLEHHVALAAAADRAAAQAELVMHAAGDDRRASGAPGRRLLHGAADAVGRGVDHRVPELGGRRLVLARRAAHHARLDAELAE